MKATPVLRGCAAAAALVLLGAGVNLAAPAPSASPVSVVRILQLALDAPRLIDYEGTKVITVLRGGRTETVTVAESHKRPDMTRLEYLSPEDVAGRVIVDNGTVAWDYEPRYNLAFEGPTMEGAPAANDLVLLRRNYRVTALGTDDVIGRQAYVLLLEPNAPGVSRELWVDRATGTVLRSEERDPSRGVVLTTYFSRISFSLNLPPAYFRFRKPAGARVFSVLPSGGKALSPAALAREARFPVLIPPALPEGYTFRGGALDRFASLTSVALRYSDGDNLLSLFEAPAGSIGWPAFGRAVKVGGHTGRFVDLGYFRVLIWEQRGLRLTAVGTVPTDTLMAIADGLATGREGTFVRSVSEQAALDPAAVRRLRAQGLTFGEIAKAAALSQDLGTNLPTAVAFVRGKTSVASLAAALGVPPHVIQEIVQEAMQHAREIGPRLSVPAH